MINNRQQNSRRRGRNNNQRPQGGNSGGNRNADNGNRIDNRSRGNAAQMLEKYKTLARDAQQSGDRVLTEYYLQFSDHYFRVLADTRARYEETPEEHHDHLIDIQSGKVVEFHNDEIEELQRKIAEKAGYRLVGHRLELYGVPVDGKNSRQK